MKILLFILYAIIVIALVIIGLYCRFNVDYAQTHYLGYKDIRIKTDLYCLVLIALFFLLGLGFGYIIF